MSTMMAEPERKEPNVIPANPADPDLHLQRLLLDHTDKPWFLTVYQNVKDYFFPEKLPPLDVTSKPVPVKDIWGFSGGQGKKAGLTSTLVHVGAVVILFAVGTHPEVQQVIKDQFDDAIPLAPYIPQAPPKAQQMGGGGGGGDRSPLPDAKGQLPKVAPRQFVPPQQVIHNPEPKLVMEPTIEVPPDVSLPQTNLPQWGNPLANIGPPSSGRGSGGGIGDGSGGGIGPGKGRGFGPGEGGGVGGGVYKIGGGVSAPALIYKVEPEYSEEARKAKFQGTVVLYVVVDEKGNPRDLRVIRPLGLGLDEKAIEAVQKWRFRPGMLQGKPVPVAATIEVNFRLL
jgi:TonB family protein